MHRPMLISVAVLRDTTKADVYLELTRNRKKARTRKHTYRPVTAGRALKESAEVGSLEVALVGGLI